MFLSHGYERDCSLLVLRRRRFLCKIVKVDASFKMSSTSICFCNLEKNWENYLLFLVGDNDMMK